MVLFKEKTDVTKNNKIAKILEPFKENPSLTTVEIATLLHLAKRTVIRDIDRLKKEKQIERVGGRKNGNWMIVAG